MGFYVYRREARIGEAPFNCLILPMILPMLVSHQPFPDAFQLAAQDAERLSEQVIDGWITHTPYTLPHVCQEHFPAGLEPVTQFDRSPVPGFQGCQARRNGRAENWPIQSPVDVYRVAFRLGFAMANSVLSSSPVMTRRAL